MHCIVGVTPYGVLAVRLGPADFEITTFGSNGNNWSKFDTHFRVNIFVNIILLRICHSL